MPSDLFLKGMNMVHRTVRAVSFGHLGWQTAGMPVLELTTVGRKSGKSRSTMLTTPLQEGDAYVIVASRGGDDHHPAWFLNLRDHPEVEVATEGEAHRSMTARVAAGEERTDLWSRLTAAHDNYAGYQRKTDREIPVVVLEPNS